jgi:hypothetical protein
MGDGELRELIWMFLLRGGPKNVTFGEIALYLLLLTAAALWLFFRLARLMLWL